MEDTFSGYFNTTSAQKINEYPYNHYIITTSEKISKREYAP